MISNTFKFIFLTLFILNIFRCPFDVTGHPAMSIPCGTDDGLPIGL